MNGLALQCPILKPAYTTYFNPLFGLAAAFWVSQYSQKKDAPLILWVADSQNQVNRIENQLAFFGVKAHVFADYETLVYDQLPVQQEVISERISLLTNMPAQGVLLVSVQTLMQRITPPSYLLGRYLKLAVGDIFDIANWQSRLEKAGYFHVENVFEPGEFAVRGSIVDIFVMGQALPLRIDLFDNQIESMRFFNPQTQRTLNEESLAALKAQSLTDESLFVADKLPKKAKLTMFDVLPAKEFPLEEGREQFRQNFASIFSDVSTRKFELYNDVMQGIAPSGIEYYLPLFFDADDWQKNGSLFSYLPSNTLLLSSGDIAAAYDGFWEKVSSRYQSYAHNKNVPILPPIQLFLPSEEFFAKLKDYPKVLLQTQNNHAHQVNAFLDAQSLALPDILINHQQAEPLEKFLTFVKTCQKPVLLVAESRGRREILRELLQDKIKPIQVDDFDEFCGLHQDLCAEKIALTVATIEDDLWFESANFGFCVITETQLFGRQILQTRRRRQVAAADAFLLKSVSELHEGALVVHLEHGIGRYQGLTVLDVGEGEQEFIHLKYAEDASIYVPITNLSLIGRYSGAETDLVPLTKIGSGKWDKAKQKTLEQIYDVAAELLNIQARRNAKEGISFSVDLPQYELFASQFAYEETADQKMAIDSVIFDMKQSKPMDRLICGDVGFGKTEVAMRAAFIAVMAGFQVAVLVPTTLLAGQHEESFRSRFADWPVRIESLSRFGTKKHQDKVLTDLAEGKIDIVIGTHKLLQDDVIFKNLGLMIIDEEHRFGVRHKQKIKAMQTDIDALAMTATPIPRTLNMALSGMQDISIIATPPARRLAIKTFVMPKQDETIKEAILREILRGGQVYFLHNDLASIDAMAQTLTELIVEARVGVAHGQMSEQNLSAVMSDFYHKKYNVLVASTIIETGIDVPSANTIIINRADKFGLAQLHQLRGRVGRSHHQAYCYLLVPSIKGLSADAKKRLDAIVRANTLGSGFILASEDLQIRGAGEILGKEQSGNMQAIGFGLYMDMLERATKAVKMGKNPKLTTALDLVNDINIHASALIPDDYLGDVHERLLIYKRIANAENFTELNEIRIEMIDRFGILPLPAEQLFDVHRLRVLSQPLGVSKMDLSENAMILEFKEDTPVDSLAIIQLLQSDSSYRMHGGSGLKQVFKTAKTVKERIQIAFELINYLQKHQMQH